MSDELEHAKMPLTAHLDELRRRLIYAIVVVFFFAIIAYAFKEPLMSILLEPYYGALGFRIPLDQVGELTANIREAMSQAICSGSPCFSPEEIDTMALATQRMLALLGGLIFTHPIEAFWTFIKFALYMGLLAGMPLILFQLWKFVVPALYQRERGYLLSFLSVGTGLFYSGAIFSYFGILPFGLQFLVGVGQGLLTPMFTIGNYISFSMLLMIVFGLCFELPLAMYIVVKMGLVKRQTLINRWRYVVVGAFVVGAVLTPPDPFTQVAMASAFIVLYGIGLVLTRFAEPRNSIETVEAAAKE